MWRQKDCKVVSYYLGTPRIYEPGVDKILFQIKKLTQVWYWLMNRICYFSWRVPLWCGGFNGSEKEQCLFSGMSLWMIICVSLRFFRHWAVPVVHCGARQYSLITLLLPVLSRTDSLYWPIYQAWPWVSCLHSAFWESSKVHLNCPLLWGAFLPSVSPAMTRWRMELVCGLWTVGSFPMTCTLCSL